MRRPLATRLDYVYPYMLGTHTGGRHRSYSAEIELEVSRSLLNRHLPGNGTWRIETDHSLEVGAELVTAYRPFAPTMAQLHDAVYSLPTAFWGAAESWRAATQLHVDMSYYSAEDMLVTLINYVAAEPRIFAWCGNGRHESNFCVPLWESPAEVIRTVGDMIHATGYPRKSGCTTLVNRLSQWPKYMALNLSPWSRMGTWEFRHMQTPAGPHAAETILRYFRFCGESTNPLVNPDRALSGWAESTTEQFVDNMHFAGHELMSRMPSDTPGVSESRALLASIHSQLTTSTFNRNQEQF